ncbi:DUF736 domain-containing protein [Sphingobium sp. BHU LFT2]|uniref:DUF736 domain-containing protein n=1 Tax=Sphingobium sp. BHU LFT2 TaxID=2807634 RepID=UPI001BEA861C|nr:DUF736 domain-containing protein [Sphingobium sp. BHU LFT2]MBT2246316.1 DUF736 domain-containing protein [Sphingobium sp. BHU LFT2]
MAIIGTFTKTGNEFKGSIVTLSVQAKNVRIVPEEDSGNDKAPSHRLLASDIAFGAAWRKTSREGRDYLSVKLDDPSFASPVYASLVEGDDGQFSLIWSR